MTVLRYAMPACDQLTPGIPEHADAAAVFQAALGALDELRQHGRPGHVLVVTPAELSRPSQLARAAAGHPGIALAEVPGPPTVLAILDLVLSRHPDLPAADALAVARAVPGRVRTQAVVSSVARLDRPRPTLLQHLASYLPWTRFALDVHEGTVRVVKDPGSAVPAGADDPVSGASVQATLVRSDSERVTADYLAGAPQALRVDVAEATTEAWSARHYVERSYLLGNPGEVVSAARARPARACDNCGAGVRASTCPFCGVRQRTGERAAA